MRLSKVYAKNGELIVCFKGGHYIAPSNTGVNSKNRVPIIQGEEPDTVIVAGSEVWTLKGSYLTPKTTVSPEKKKTRKTRVKTTVPEALEPSQEVLDEIGVVAPNPNAESLLRVMYANWLRGCTHLNLFQGLNYTDPGVTSRVHALGQKIMDEFRAKATT